MKGAESLLGRGDMLYNPVGAPKPIRVQGAFVSDEEVYGLTSHIKSRWEAVYEDEVASAIEGAEIIESKEPLDPMIEDAIRLVVSNKSGSTSMLQRVLKVGHTRAMNLMTQMEVFGVVGPFEDKKPRKVLWTIEDVESRAHTLV
jgi:S-DNA-T family DNA segregation ATPase FtsK/SpoIIIE